MSWRASHPKREAQRVHAKRRAAERYGLILNRSDLREIVLAIQRQQATFLFKESNRLTHYALDFQGKRVVVVYDKQRKTIVTFLPPEAEHQYPTQGAEHVQQNECAA